MSAYADTSFLISWHTADVRFPAVSALRRTGEAVVNDALLCISCPPMLGENECGGTREVRGSDRMARGLGVRPVCFPGRVPILVLEPDVAESPRVSPCVGHRSR